MERLIEQKIPVAISVSLGLLRERSKEKSDGHIVVVCGLDSQGNVWVNDPDATIPLTQKKPVRRLYPRAAVIRAWASSHQTAYVLTRRGERLDAIEK